MKWVVRTEVQVLGGKKTVLGTSHPQFCTPQLGVRCQEKGGRAIQVQVPAGWIKGQCQCISLPQPLTQGSSELVSDSGSLLVLVQLYIAVPQGKMRQAKKEIHLSLLLAISETSQATVLDVNITSTPASRTGQGGQCSTLVRVKLPDSNSSPSFNSCVILHKL